MPSQHFLPLVIGARPAIPSLNRLEAAPHNITRLNRDIRVIGDTRVTGYIRERIPCRKTPIDIHSKLKTRIIKN